MNEKQITIKLERKIDGRYYAVEKRISGISYDLLSESIKGQILHETIDKLDDDIDRHVKEYMTLGNRENSILRWNEREK